MFNFMLNLPPLDTEAEPLVKMAATKVALELLKQSLVVPHKVAVRSFHCTPICERLIRTFREKPRPDNRPVKYVPYQGKTEVKPRDDVYFLRSQDPPSHTFQEALDVLRAYAFHEETVRVNLRLDMKEKKVMSALITLFACHQTSCSCPVPDCILCSAPIVLVLL